MIEALHRARRRADLATRQYQRAEDARRESEGRHRALVEWLPEPVFVHRDGKLLFVNQAAIKMLGATSAQDLVGKPIFDLIHPDFHQAVHERLKTYAAGADSPRIETRLITLDGAVIDVESQATSIVYDGEPAIVGSFRDVTERKRAEASVQASQTRLRLLVKSSNVGLWDWNLVTNDVFFSPEWKQQLGYADHALPNRYEEWERRLHPDDREPTLEAVKAYIEGRHADYDREFRMRHKDGSWRWILARADVIRGGAGTPVRMLGCHIDITERKGVEAAQEESEARYRALVEWSPESIAVSRGGRILFLNPAAVRMMGATSEQDMVGKSILDWVHPDFHPIVRERVKSQTEIGGLLPLLEQKFVRLDGTVIDVENQGRSIIYNGEPATLSSMRDITERKRAEAAAAQLATIVESSDDAIIGKDLRGIVTSWNAGAEKVFGYSAPEMIGQSITRLIPPERRQEEVEILDQISRGKSVRHFETERVRKDGITLDVSVTVSPVKDRAGRVVGASKVARDITEHRKVAAALRLLSGRLLRLEDEERRRLARELHDSTAQRLAALGMNLSVANEGIDALDGRAQRALAESMALADECLREVRTVSYLLHPPELEELGLHAALARYIEGFSQRSGISVETEVAPDLGRLPHAIETTVFRIVQECLTNIHRHSGSRTASIHLHRGPEDLVLQVQDAGTGVRGNAPLGVGIASMQERLQPFGGSLEISSRPGGTNVKALIPLSHVAV